MQIDGTCVNGVPLLTSSVTSTPRSSFASGRGRWRTTRPDATRVLYTRTTETLAVGIVCRICARATRSRMRRTFGAWTPRSRTCAAASTPASTPTIAPRTGTSQRRLRRRGFDAIRTVGAETATVGASASRAPNTRRLRRAAGSLDAAAIARAVARASGLRDGSRLSSESTMRTADSGAAGDQTPSDGASSCARRSPIASRSSPSNGSRPLNKR